jgi:type II secretory pathway predicted ATPase ExeA
MYLEHFGLKEPPFKITPVTVFFFSGANRGEILDALIYSISEIEGIIKVSGEVGSGKTMLCRMLLERLPKHIETIYLANPSLSREEMLYAIADGLGLAIEGERVGIIMQTIQNKLEEKAREGKRVVVLVDEAHAMPLDTLEELRLLYNLQVGNSKLLQIVLFGQPELNAKLEQPNMRQLKDRIVHHFNIQPLSRGILSSYLMFRMRAAGYRGPDIFSPESVKLIADASRGLMRRVNVLADKALLAAFVEGKHNIDVRHVKTAINDSESKPTRTKHDALLLTALGGSLLAIVGIAWLILGRNPTHTPQPAATQTLPGSKPLAATSAVPPSPVADASNPAMLTNPAASSATTAMTAPPNTAAITQSNVSPPPVTPPIASNPVPEKPTGTLFEQRLAAGKLLQERKQAIASIQLFYNEEVNPQRMEGFLRRADGLGKLGEIYILPARFGGKDGLRALYGAYPSVDAARAALKELPQRYQDAFATTIYIF